METKTVKISLSSKKVKFFVMIVIAIVFFTWLIMRDKKSQNVQDKQQEFVLPINFGVSDPGFEGKITNFTMLNAQASIDANEKIDDKSSLKIAFSDQAIASVKVPDYFNTISEGSFYRLSFWAKSNSSNNKQITLRIAEKEKTQDLGKFSINETSDVTYFEFNFQANNNAQDLFFTSSDGIASNVWIDNVLVEKIEIDSLEKLKELKATISGNTTWKNIDQYQSNDSGNSEDFFSQPTRKMGQIFHPTENMLSGVAFKILRHGTGATGTYQVQLREFDENLGIISDTVLASATLKQAPSSEILKNIKEKEKAMREAFAVNEQNIKDGKTPNDTTGDQYPNTFTQDQIDAAKVVKRTAKLEVDVREMKDGFNVIEEISIPLAVKLDVNKKYWIGIDNAGAAVNRNDYISVINSSSINTPTSNETENQDAKIVKQEGVGGFMSEVAGTWMNSSALWFKTFYPKNYVTNNNTVLSGATISDMGNGKLIYRYHFSPNDSTSISGFSGRKIYDMTDGSYLSIDVSGNYKLSYDDFAVYKFNTFYPANKIIVRSADFHQSLALEISTDGENWEEIYADNPAADSQSINPIVFNTQEKTTAFYIRIKSNGDSSTPYGLSVEAELEE